MKDIGLVLLGALLAILTTQVNDWRYAHRQRKAALARLWMTLEGITISMKVLPVWRKAGGIETWAEAFDLEEPWKHSIPPRPPSIPSDFDTVAEQIALWETSGGNYELTKLVSILKGQLKYLNTLHEMLADVTRANEGKDVPERPIAIYKGSMEELEKLTEEMLRQVAHLRRSFHERVLRWIWVHSPSWLSMRIARWRSGSQQQPVAAATK